MGGGGLAMTGIWRGAGHALRRTCLAAALLLAAGAAAAADGRVALIVGNAAYKDAPLATPLSDAEDMAGMLTGLGFDVTLLKDAKADELRQAVKAFSEKSAKADTSIVYFAGHSVYYAGDQYVVPVDATMAPDASLAKETLPLGMFTLAAARSRTFGLVVLDAFRPNALVKKDRQEQIDGMAVPVDQLRNVLFFFAAEKDKTVTVDADGRNAPLTKALLKYIPQKELEINFLFRNVRDDVRKATGSKQTPFMYGQLSRTKIYLGGAPESRHASAARELGGGRDPNAVHPCDTYATSPADVDRLRWVKGVRTEDIQPEVAQKACEEAIRRFPGVSRFPFQLGRVAMASKDYPAALAQYTKAFELGNTLALHELGTMYADGVGVGRDPVRARFYFELAIEKKHAPSMVSLAEQYERGVGAPPDLKKAYGYYMQAADLGNARAVTKVAMYTEKGVTIAKNLKQARDLYEMGATMGDDVAMLHLARFYANGIGGKKDLTQAKNWLVQASEAGSEDAKRVLAEIDKAQHKSHSKKK
jgi:TPR repeat protein